MPRLAALHAMLSVGGGVPDAPPHRTINNASVGVGLPDDPPGLAAHFPKKNCTTRIIQFS